MKAISLWQPWASLVMSGNKKIETRTWATHIRGPVIIHAAKRMDDEAKMYFRSPPNLPCGAILGLVEITGVKKYTRADWEQDKDKHLCYFEWTDPRYGWQLGTLRYIFSRPVAYRGRQGIWNVPITPELIAAAGLPAEHFDTLKKMEEKYGG